MSKEPSVVLVGRTNVGKSTLFNRLSSSVKSLTLDLPGVTRDLVKDHVEWQGKKFELVDTGGISLRKTNDELVEKVRQQVLKIIEDAQIILYVVDGSVGITQEDREIANFLHSLPAKIFVVFNKSDCIQTQDHFYEATGLGFKDIFLVSAAHARGIDELLHAISDHLPSRLLKEETKSKYRIMLLGRPNVGKSSLMNCLLNFERSIVSNQPGTTREPITESIAFYKESLALTDTPGIRRKRAIDTQLETMMIKSAFQSLKSTDIVALIIDATEKGLVDQDLKLAYYAFQEEYKALVLIVNKYDLVTESDQESLNESFEAYKHLVKKVPLLRISCKTGKNIGKLLPTFEEVWQRYSREFSEVELTTLFLAALRDRPLVQTKQFLKIRRVYQVKKAPPTIVLEVYNTTLWRPSHLNFFENLMRKEYDLEGVPLRFIIRGKQPKRQE